MTAAYTLASPKTKIKPASENGKPVIPVDTFDKGKGPKVIVVEIEGKPIVEESLTQTQADGRIVMNANNAKLQEGEGLKIIGAHTHDPNRPNAIGQWKDLEDRVFWDIKIQKPGKYKVLINYLPNNKHRGKIMLSMLGQQLPWEFITEQENKFKEMSMGIIEVSQQVIGEPSTKVILQATSIEGDTLPEIASITLVPIQE